MKTIKILKNLGYMFYILTGITVIIFLIVSINTGTGFADGIALISMMCGFIFLFLGFVFFSVSSIILDKRIKNQSSGLPDNISSYLESKKDSKKMFKIGLFAFVGVGLMLIVNVIIFFDGRGDNLEKPYLVLLTILTLVGVVSWTLAIMRYFRK